MDTTAFLPTKLKSQRTNKLSTLLDELKNQGDATFAPLNRYHTVIVNTYYFAKRRGFRVSITGGTLAGVDGYLVTRK